MKEDTKESALEKLNNFAFYQIDNYDRFTFPIKDEVYYMESVNYENHTEIKQQTFLHLIKIAYNLKDNG